MKICVVGAGAIGGLLAARLSHGGEDVSVIARGAHLDAIRESGLRLEQPEGEAIEARVAASDRIDAFGPQDCVILGMKAHQVAAVVKDLPALFHDDTMVLTAQNGIPWWYFFKHGGSFEGRRLNSVDPDGTIAASLPIDRVVGSVVYPAAEIVAPGRIRLIEGNRFSLSEIDNRPTSRVERLSEAFKAAGFKAPVVSDIRAEIWTKLWGNLSFNPLSALTHSTLEDICADERTRELVARIMREAQQVGEALGIRFRVSIEKRIAGAAAVGAHKTSMLQDIEAGRPIEADALLGSVLELGAVAGVATPTLEAVFALVTRLARSLAQQRGKLSVSPV